MAMIKSFCKSIKVVNFLFVFMFMLLLACRQDQSHVFVSTSDDKELKLKPLQCEYIVSYKIEN